MTTNINVSDLPEYAPAAAKFKADKKLAETNGDDEGIKKAEMDWRETQLNLRELAMTRTFENTRVEDARAKAKAEYPKVSESVYAHLTDPDAILEVAKTTHETIEAAVRENTQSWGQATPPGSAATGQPANNPGPKDYDQQQAELAPEVLKGLPGERANNQFRANIFAEKLAPRFASVQLGQQQNQQK